MGNSLAWTLNRLRCMSVAEIAHRVQVKAQTTWESAGLGLATRVPPRTSQTTHCWLPTASVIDDTDSKESKSRYLERADRVLQGRYDVFALHNADVGFPPQWNRDPLTGREAPMGFGKTLNYRDESIAGDIKYLWEINRHRELLWLAQAWSLSRDTRYLDGIGVLVRSWLDQCPYPRGVNWTSSLEHSVRIIHWSAVWSLIGGSPSPLFEGETGEALRDTWLDCIYRHAHFIHGHFSRHSSANNHLIGEYAGLFVAATVWPLWPECEAWRARASRGLEEEVQRQTFDDGFNREQAIWYHHEVTDLFLICSLVARATGHDFSDAYGQRLESMLDAIALLMDCAGNVPALGDADDAVYLELGLERDVYRSLLSSGAIVFERADFKARLKALDGRSRWLHGAAGAERYHALQPEARKSVIPAALPDAGYYILGAGADTENEIRLTLDSGSLGYLSIAAHGHADALSLLLSVGGMPILIDPGTYAYHTNEQWRRYFRGTEAHNTVTVDGLDQSQQAGNFMWLQHAAARCLHFETKGDQQIWEAEHDGYRRLADPVDHRRRVVFDAGSGLITVTDFLDCREAHDVTLHWHTHPGCDTSLASGVGIVRREGVTVSIRMPESDWTADCVRGSETPPLGWISERFDDMAPTNTLRFCGTISASCALTTQIKIDWDG